MLKVYSNYNKYLMSSKKSVRAIETIWSFDSMCKKFETMLDSSLPKFAEKMKLSLPQLKELPKLKKITPEVSE